MSSNDEIPLHTIDRTPEYEEFIENLRVYHEKRGTPFDPEPKVSNMSIDLLKTFNHIVANGGYDKVSDEKLAWRRMREQLGIRSTNPPAAAYSLKEKYLKLLAAYEISTIHGKEPPPKDILEDCTAKGGSLLTRTRENFYGGKLSAAGDDSAASGDDGTPSRERASTETTPAASSTRATRGLREAPPQRVIFQPETSSSTRPTRHSSGAQPATPGQPSPAAPNRPGSSMQGISNSPVPFPPVSQAPGQVSTTPVPLPRTNRGPSSSFNPPNNENVASAVDSYQPRSLQQQLPIQLRPVDTPGNNPTEFARRRQIAHQRLRPAPLPLGTPGVGRDGAGIYHRCLMGLRSKIPDEQAYALYHLVKISYERFDKFRFEQFSGLAEGLVEKVLEVGSLFYEVEWDISWIPNTGGGNVLDGELGSPDILERIDRLEPKPFDDLVIPGYVADQLLCINEAALTMRNMTTMSENASFISDLAPVKDAICIVLRLPAKECLVELKHHILEISEQLTPWMSLDEEDPLYQVLMDQLYSDDRGIILGGLRALGRISMNLAETNALGNVPGKIVEKISQWLYLNDDELMDSCLDFLYQYTAVVGNVDTLLRSVTPEHLITQLVRLLGYGAKTIVHKVVTSPEQKTPAREQPAPMPQDLFQDLMRMPEPDRCQQWVKSFFEQDDESFITQITAWQAYNNAFSAAVKAAGQQMITPAEFIRNSTTVYKDSKAEVRQLPGTGEKFIIQGIRVRTNPLSITGNDFSRCLWDSKPGEKCGEYFGSPDAMVRHIFVGHLGEVPNAQGQWDNRDKEVQCQWGDCRRFVSPTKMPLLEFTRHLMTHARSAFPRQGPGDSEDPYRTRPTGFYKPAESISLTYEETQYSRENPNGPPQPAGIPLSAALILRNIARNAPRTQSQEELLKETTQAGESGGWNERLFRLVRPRLMDIMTKNEVLRDLMYTIMELAFQDSDA